MVLNHCEFSTMFVTLVIGQSHVPVFDGTIEVWQSRANGQMEFFIFDTLIFIANYFSKMNCIFSPLSRVSEGLRSFQKRWKIKTEQETIEMCTKLFYNVYADAEVRLMDDEVVKFNKGMLCVNAQSKILFQIFFGDLQDKVTHITDIDSKTFKLLLDHVMSFESYTFESAFKIFPAAWKYQISHVIDSCIQALTCTDLSDSQFCEVFNMAAFFSCEQLIAALCDFKSPISVLSDRNICHALEPESVNVLISKISKINHFMILILIGWGENYMKKNETGCTSVRDFLEKVDLLKFFKLEYFEMPSEIYDFVFKKGGENFFTPEETLRRLAILASGESWKVFEKGETFTDELILEGLINALVPDLIRYDLHLNDVKFSGGLELHDKKETLIICNAQYSGRGNSDEDYEICYKSELRITREMLEKGLVQTIVFKKSNPQAVGARFRGNRKYVFEWTFLHPCLVLFSAFNDSEKLNWVKRMVLKL